MSEIVEREIVPYRSPDTPAQPHNEEVEQALLGTILTNNDAYERVSAFLKPEHFHIGIHQQIYEMCGALIGEGKRADPKTLRPFLGKTISILGNNGLPEEVPTHKYLAVLAYEAVGIETAFDYGRTIVDLSVRRKMIAVADQAKESAVNATPDTPVAKLLDGVESWFAELRTTHHLKETELSLKADIQDALDLAAKAYKASEPAGWPWFIQEAGLVLDSRLEPGNVYGLLGASGDGKTSFVMQQLRFGAENGVPGLFLTGEQSKTQCIWQSHVQHLSHEAELKRCAWNFSAQDIRDGKLDEAAFDLMVEDAQRMARLPLAIQKWSELKIADLGVRVRRFVKKYGPGVIAIDHFKKIVPNSKNDIFAQQIFQVGEGLKDIASETGCAVIVLMHRNSDFLDRRVMRPIRADVFGKENGLQNLDGCLAVYRAERWLRERQNLEEKQEARDRIERQIVGDSVAGIAGEQGRADFYALKSRFGEESRHQKVRFVARYTRFESLGRRSAQEDLL